MKSALIGHTGFVGQNLKSQFSFTHMYNSQNIQDIKGEQFDLLVFAGARAEKWKANQNPLADEVHINELIAILENVEAKEAILISTVDVYSNPSQVNENTQIDMAKLQPYGKNRYRLEDFFRTKFSDSLTVRLPGLFGTGIKKNVIFDFIHNNQIENIDSRAIFQFYNLEHIWSDISKCRCNDLQIVNFATQPVSVEELHFTFFGKSFKNEVSTKPALYDMQTLYSRLWSQHLPYLYSKDIVLSECKEFFRKQRQIKCS
jgi:hypothetical protein